MGTKAATEVRMTSTTSSSVMPKDSRSFAPKRKGDYGNGGAPGESYNVDNGGGTTLWRLTSPKRTSPNSPCWC